jgi:gamma-glutamylcyclotransferase (GGCT)/AIG2-like uncharacterized protein YtfP
MKLSTGSRLGLLEQATGLEMTMKKNKKKQKPRMIRVSMNQEEAEMSYSETHLVEDLMRRKNDNTPDFYDLKLRQNHFVFVYGTLKKGDRNAFLLDGCPYIGEGYIAVKGFNMKLNPFGHFPIIFDSKGKDAEHIWGEVYVVDARKIAELDRLENNGAMYKRQPLWVWLEDQRVSSKDKTKNNLKPAERCWVYVGNPMFWQGRDMIDYPTMRYADRTVYNYHKVTAERLKNEDKKKEESAFTTWMQESAGYLGQEYTHDDDFRQDVIPF